MPKREVEEWSGPTRSDGSGQRRVNVIEHYDTCLICNAEIVGRTEKQLIHNMGQHKRIHQNGKVKD